jgi:hypothetical protein
VPLADVSGKGFQVSLQQPEMRRLKLIDLRFERSQAIEPAFEKEKIESEVPSADRKRGPRTCTAGVTLNSLARERFRIALTEEPTRVTFGVFPSFCPKAPGDCVPSSWHAV